MLLHSCSVISALLKGDALAGQLVHCPERTGADIADDLVEGRVDGAVAGGLLVPGRGLVLDALAVGLGKCRSGSRPQSAAG
jgi:hypothetical protein